MRLNALLIAFAVTFGLSLSAPSESVAQEASYVFDGAHTNIGFKVRHNVISWVYGNFTEYDGSVTYDPSKIEKTSAKVTIQVGSINTDNAKRDEHLKSADFFDAAGFATITFESTGVENVDKDGSFDLVGNLTMRGVTKEVTLSVDAFAGPVNDPWGNTKIGTTATLKIDRQDFGVNWSKTLDAGGLVVGNEVHITLDLELNQTK